MLKLLNGVGPKTLDELNNEGVYTVSDLLYRFPRDYLVFSHSPEKVFECVDTYIEGYVDSNVAIFKHKGESYAFSFYLKYDNVRLKMCIFTNIHVGVKIKNGMTLGVYGRYHALKKVFNIKKIFFENLGFKIEVDYKIKGIPNTKLQKLMKEAFNKEKDIKESLPLEILLKYRLLGIRDYLYKSHFPESKDDIKEVIRRRKYEEFYWYSLSLAYLRNKRIVDNKPVRNIDINIKDEFINNLAFDLTLDQLKAIDDVIKDLKNPYPMNRLVEGDVGCGKTIVGIIASLLMAKAGFQVAIMAPTEVLANQEYDECVKYLGKYNLNITLLTSSVSEKDKKTILSDLKDGKIDIICGTHSLLYGDIKFNNLGLAIIDEQHRFGVNQRLALINKHKNVDAMFFSATPIPRTLGLTFINELDISSIKTMPSSRKKVMTKILPFSRLNGLFKSLKNHLDQNEKAYVVVPLIDNDGNDCMDILECSRMLKERFSEYGIGILHGKMKSNEKDIVINAFKNGRFKILISTTVVEVGVNVTDATMMIIMNAERFGLSTLHQLRGRVGRGSLESYCMLISNDINNPRLNALCDTTDGFEISEMDFKLRGPGNYLGEEQSGFQELEYASFKEDLNILKCAKEDSERLIKKYLSKELKSVNFDKIEKSGNELNKTN